jgi:hypothetical protein
MVNSMKNKEVTPEVTELVGALQALGSGQPGMVRLGLTPKLAARTEPSQIYMFR